MSLDWALLSALVALGAVAGFLAGLFGIGGGMVMVPALTFLLAGRGVPVGHVVHMAVATASATICFTSLSSIRSHYKRGAVLLGVAAWIAAGVLVGGFVGPQVASLVSSAWLALVFGLFVAYTGLQMLRDTRASGQRPLPGPATRFAVGTGIGFASSIVGAGGGFLAVPFLNSHGVPIHSAVGTSAALGFPIAVASTLGFVIAGWSEPGLPPYSLGYVYLPALAGIVVASVLTAPLGARAAHALPVRPLKRGFGVLLFGVAALMLWKAVGWLGWLG